MEFKLYENAGLVAIEQNGKFSLCAYIDVEDEDEKGALIALDFAQEVSSLEVYENCALVVTPEAVFSYVGEKILEKSAPISIVKAGHHALISTPDNKGAYGKRLVVWDGEKVVLNTSCSDFRYSNRYLALKYKSIWSLFKIDGTPIDEGAFVADDIEICRDLVVTKRLARHGLYSIKKKAFLKENQTKVVASKECNLALCAKIGEDAINVYSAGRWHTIPEVDEFDLVKGMEHLFYVKRGKKYLVYEDDMTRFMQHMYPNGVDFVAYNNGVLFVINDGEPAFYHKN